MKQLIVLLLTLSTTVTFSQNSQTVDLRWKIDKGEPVTYSTVMKEIDTSIMDINMGELFDELVDDSVSQEKMEESRRSMKKMRQAFNNLDYITTLTARDGGVVDITIGTQPKTTEDEADSTDFVDDELTEIIQSLNQEVVLRGSVYETGEIHSFWVKSNQKNLISLFFELPSHPVKVGDTWELDINLIANDQNFICDSAYKRNEVTLKSLKEVNGETIAVLNYDIVEYVMGDFNSPFSGSGDGEKTMMQFTHQATAEFSVDNGYWISYDGIMSLEGTGFLSADQRTQFSLIKN